MSLDAWTLVGTVSFVLTSTMMDIVMVPTCIFSKILIMIPTTSLVTHVTVRPETVDIPDPVWARQVTCSSPTTGERSEPVPPNLKPRALNDG
jgi:hypothetical protein